MRTWARDLLGRLDDDARNLRRTLRTWIAAGGNAERAAHTLGMHAQTVREHVRRAEPVLERQLLAAGSDLYEVVPAHLVVGELDQPVLAGTIEPQVVDASCGEPVLPAARDDSLRRPANDLPSSTETRHLPVPHETKRGYPDPPVHG